MRCNSVIKGTFLSIMLLCSAKAVVFANNTSEDEVILTVQGYGDTEEQATLSALRSAIEQTYGVFVSANTEILNDSLVKDEIVSISTGNIKKYDKMDAILLPNHQMMVTIRATVSISNLISYAKSKGSSAEFSGQAFAMDIKLKKLRIDNTKKAYANMCNQICSLLKNAVDYQVTISEPIREVAYLHRFFISPYYAQEGITSLDYDNCECPNPMPKWWPEYKTDVTISIIINEVFAQIVTLYFNTIKSLSLNEYDLATFKKYNLPTTCFGIWRKDYRFSYGYELKHFFPESYYVPIERSDYNRFEGRILSALCDVIQNYDVIYNGVKLEWRRIKSGDFFFSRGSRQELPVSGNTKRMKNYEKYIKAEGLFLNNGCAIVSRVPETAETDRFFDSAYNDRKYVDYMLAHHMLCEVCRYYTKEKIQREKRIDLDKLKWPRGAIEYKEAEDNNILSVEQFESFLATLPQTVMQQLVKMNMPKNLLAYYKKEKVTPSILALNVPEATTIIEKRETISIAAPTSKVLYTIRFPLYFSINDLSEFKKLEIIPKQ